MMPPMPPMSYLQVMTPQVTSSGCQMTTSSCLTQRSRQQQQQQLRGLV
jgi:hypothetical protein